MNSRQLIHIFTLIFSTFFLVCMISCVCEDTTKQSSNFTCTQSSELFARVVGLFPASSPDRASAALELSKRPDGCSWIILAITTKTLWKSQLDAIPDEVRGDLSKQDTGMLSILITQFSGNDIAELMAITELLPRVDRGEYTWNKSIGSGLYENREVTTKSLGEIALDVLVQHTGKKFGYNQIAWQNYLVREKQH